LAAESTRSNFSGDFSFFEVNGRYQSPTSGLLESSFACFNVLATGVCFTGLGADFADFADLKDLTDLDVRFITLRALVDFVDFAVGDASFRFLNLLK
jgi:hypothetical protein